MNADSRMAISLVLSLLISAENLRMAAMGEADIVAVGWRYVLGFLIVFVLVGMVGGLVNAYVAQHHRQQAEQANEAGASMAPPTMPSMAPDEGEDHSLDA